MKRIEAIIHSMTPKERTNPNLLNPSRKNRIAKGAGVDVAEVNRLVKQFEQMKKMMKQMPGMMGGRGKRGKRGYVQRTSLLDKIIKTYEEVKIMAVKIRLRRMGQKKAPFYRIVVADSRSPRDGRCIEEIGTYDPTKDPSEYHVDAELAKKWLSNGAQPTETVNRIFKAAGIEK